MAAESTAYEDEFDDTIPGLPDTGAALEIAAMWLPGAGALAAVTVIYGIVVRDSTVVASSLAIAVLVLAARIPQATRVVPFLAPFVVLALAVTRETFNDHFREAMLLALGGAVACGASALLAYRQRTLQQWLRTNAQALERRTIRDAVNDSLAVRRRDNYVDREFVRAQRYGREVTVAVAEIDNLELLLRERGPQATMEVLSKLGELFSTDSRLPDGGLSDDMRLVFVLPETPLQGGRVVAERVRLGFQALHLRGADDVPFTVSIGVASYPADGQRAPEIIAAAREALQRAIDAGGNRTMLSRSLAGMPPGWSGAAN